MLEAICLGGVQEIQRLTSSTTWRFCPGKENPADLPSRSCEAVDLVVNKEWWNGPDFLKCNSDQWPDLVITFDGEDAKEELIKHSPTIIHSLVNTSAQNSNS